MFDAKVVLLGALINNSLLLPLSSQIAIFMSMQHVFNFVFKLIFFWVIFFGHTTGIKAQATDSVNITDENGLKQGYWLKKDNFGRKVYEGHFVDDVPTGTFRYFYDNGRLKAISEISSGGRNAFTITYHPNGRKMSEGNYEDRKRDSVWLIYDAHGQLLTSETYKNGLLHGRHITFFQNGDTAEIVHYENGLRENEWLQFHRNGKIKTKGFLHNDTIHDTTFFYYHSGQKRLTAIYDMGTPVGEWHYFLEDGRAEKVEYYQDGEITGREVYIEMPMNLDEKQ
jgi:antitoxin component YwqK of YwqJK toxin-antitoxin module